MRAAFAIISACCLLLSSARSARATDSNTVATVTVTNTAGTAQGETISIYWQSTNAITSTWSTNSGFRLLPVTNSAARAATNLYTALAAAWTNKLYVSYASSTAVLLRTIAPGSVLSVAVSSNWATVVNATSAPANNASLTVSNLDAQIIHVGSIIIGGGTNSNVHTNGWADPWFRNSLTLSNFSTAYTVPCLAVPGYAVFCPLSPPGQCPDPNQLNAPVQCNGNNPGGGGIFQNTNGDVLVLLGNGCPADGVRGTIQSNSIVVTNAYTYIYSLTNIVVAGSLQVDLNGTYTNAPGYGAGYLQKTTAPTFLLQYQTGNQWAAFTTSLDMVYVGFYLNADGSCLIGPRSSVNSFDPGFTFTFNAPRPPFGFVPDISTNAAATLANTCCMVGYLVIPGTNGVMRTNFISGEFLATTNNAIVSSFPTNANYCFTCATILSGSSTCSAPPENYCTFTGSTNCVTLRDPLCSAIRTQ